MWSALTSVRELDGILICEGEILMFEALRIS